MEIIAPMYASSFPATGKLLFSCSAQKSQEG